MYFARKAQLLKKLKGFKNHFKTASSRRSPNDGALYSCVIMAFITAK